MKKMDILADISLVFYLMVGIFLLIILGIAIKRYLESRGTPGEKTSFLFLLMGITGVFFLIIYLIGLFTTPDTLIDLIQQRLFFTVLVTLPFIFDLFAIQTQFGDFLDTGRLYTLVALITYLTALIIDWTFGVKALWSLILFYGVAAACATPSIYLWIKLIRVARVDLAMDTLKFYFYLVGFTLLDGFYIHNFLNSIIYGEARVLFQVQIDFIDSILFLGVVIFIVMAQLRSRTSSS